MTQLKDRVELIKLGVKQATDEQDKIADVMKFFLPKQYQRDVATLLRSKLFIGAIAALGADAGLSLGDPLKEAACTAVYIFNLCDDTSSLSQDVDQILKKQEETIATLQGVQRPLMKTSSYLVTKSGQCNKMLRTFVMLRMITYRS